MCRDLRRKNGAAEKSPTIHAGEHVSPTPAQARTFEQDATEMLENVEERELGTKLDFGARYLFAGCPASSVRPLRHQGRRDADRWQRLH